MSQILIVAAAFIGVFAPPPEKAPPPKPLAEKPAPEPKKVTFKMKDVPWDEVLDWYSNESGLTPIYNVKPTGKFTFIPPKPDARYTLEEITDILNEAMASQKLFLLRRQVSYTIISTTEKLDFGPIPRYEVSDLEKLPKTQLVQLLIPLTNMAVEEVAPEVRKLLTPYGEVSTQTKTNTLVIFDSAGNLRRIVKIIEHAEAGSQNFFFHRCLWKKAQDIADDLKVLLTDREPLTLSMSPQVQLYFEPYGSFSSWDPREWGRSATARGNKISITVDVKANTLTIIGPPEKIALAKKVIEQKDREKKYSDPQLRKYSVAPGTAEAAARMLEDNYPGVRVIALPTTDEVLVLANRVEHLFIRLKLRVLYPEPQVTDGIETAIIPVDGFDPEELAKKLAKLFPSTAAGGAIIEAHVGSIPGIIVRGTPAQIKDIRATIAVIEGVRAKKFTVQFKKVPWTDVLAWYAKGSGLKDFSTAKPEGSITIQPPKDRQFTLGEVSDLLNEALTQQKLILIRGEKSFAVVPTDEKIDPKLIPRIELSELPHRGKTELVRVLIPLGSLAVEDTAPEVQKMLTPFGTVSMIRFFNVLVVSDTAGNLNRIYRTLPDGEPRTVDDYGTYRCQWKKAQDVADTVKVLLFLWGTETSPPQPYYDPYGRGGYDPYSRPLTGRVRTLLWINVDAKANTLTVSGPPGKIALVKGFVTAIDKPSSPNDKPIRVSEPELRRYSVSPGTADATAKALLADDPSLRVIALPVTNEILVLATPEVHFLTLGKLGSGSGCGTVTSTTETAVIPVNGGDLEEIAIKLAKLFPSTAVGGPTIEAQIGGQPGIIVRGTPAQIEDVRATIKECVEKKK
jgi:type II secretory pathway component GspD/PulD (secretin)